VNNDRLMACFIAVIIALVAAVGILLLKGSPEPTAEAPSKPAVEAPSEPPPSVCRVVELRTDSDLLCVVECHHFPVKRGSWLLDTPGGVAVVPVPCSWNGQPVARLDPRGSK